MVEAPGTNPANAEQTPVTVLVIDDDADLRGYIRDCLKRHGNGTTVLEAASAHEALDVLGRTAPNLVITDVVMPDMDGFALARQIRLSHEADALPILLVTGELSRRAASARAASVGAQAALCKPFNAQELCAVVARLLSTRAPPVAPSQRADFFESNDAEKDV